MTAGIDQSTESSETEATVGPGGVPSAAVHVPALDGLRGLAILLVLVYHQTLVNPATAVNAFDSWFFGAASSGWCGVDLFFVLSGYLITGILHDSKHATHYFRNFYVRRTVRIFPLYYGVVFLALVVLPNLPEGVVPASKLANFGRVEGDEIWYWLYLSNFSIANAGAWRHGILDISWSLAIEEQFYLVWPTVVLLLSRRALMRLCAALVVFALALRVGMSLAGVSWIAIYVLTPARIDLLAIGAFIALAARDPAGIAPLVRPARRVAVAAAVPLALWFFAHGELRVKDPLVHTLGFTLLGLLFGGLLVATLASPPGRAAHRLFTARGMRAFGKYSYALYLFHVPLRALLRDTVFGRAQFPSFLGSELFGQLLFYGAATALTFAMALASWNLYEKQFLKLKRYFPTELRR